MPRNTCDWVLVHCIDFRIQARLSSWAEERLGHANYDRLAIPGGVLDAPYVLKQIETFRRLHQISRVVLINHENCMAYGEAGTPERLRADLGALAARVRADFPSFEVEAYFLFLDGRLEPV